MFGLAKANEKIHTVDQWPHHMRRRYPNIYLDIYSTFPCTFLCFHESCNFLVFPCTQIQTIHNTALAMDQLGSVWAKIGEVAFIIFTDILYHVIWNGTTNPWIGRLTFCLSFVDHNSMIKKNWGLQITEESAHSSGQPAAKAKSPALKVCTRWYESRECGARRAAVAVRRVRI